MVRRANAFGAGGLVPDRTIILMRDIELSLAKAAEKGPDRLEAEDLVFHRKVHAAFAALAEREPERVRLVRLQDSKAHTADAVFSQLADLFPAACTAADAANKTATDPATDPAAGGIGPAKPFVIDDELIQFVRENR
jgi:hypothetical protein